MGFMVFFSGNGVFRSWKLASGGTRQTMPKEKIGEFHYPDSPGDGIYA